MTTTLADLETEPNVVDMTLVSDMNLQEIYEKSLGRVREIFEDGAQEAALGIEVLAPFMAAAEELNSCTAMQAQVLYTRLSKGHEILSALLGKATFDLNQAITQYKMLRGQYYLEEFAHYVERMKKQGVKIKDTDASRDHFINTQASVVEQQNKVDFLKALVLTYENWKLKIYSDMTSARNIVYAKRYSDSLSTSAN